MQETENQYIKSKIRKEIAVTMIVTQLLPNLAFSCVFNA